MKPNKLLCAGDYAMWNKAMGDSANIDGVMYTTWENDYSDLGAFAGRWWGGTVSKYYAVNRLGCLFGG
ncbi:MAG TPA: hypothetical protein PKB02_12385 [Anaerohalosphaeraceae bacterium]|nr:hypothetical protein [Anaerohalosphaeraceae bacterium]